MANSAASAGDSAGDGSAKRRKTSVDHNDVENMSDLSSDSLAAIAQYLPKTSRALMAVALTAPPSSWRERGWTGKPSDAGRAILLSGMATFDSVLEMNKSELGGSPLFQHDPEGLAREKIDQQRRMEEYYGASNWGILDFLDLEKDLASKLTDDDIGAVLACIDAGNSLKELRLTKCTGIVGEGLEPLRGSSVLEQIDFDILHLIPSYDRRYKLEFSPEKAFSIIGSMLAGEASAFRRMQVPTAWLLTSRKENENKLFVDFLAGHTHALNVSARCCYFGIGESNEDFVNNFKIEQRNAPTESCKDCGACNYISCADCNAIICEDLECRLNCTDALVCSQCSKTSCRWCVKKGGASVKWCESDMCDDYCDDCRYISCRGGGNDCQFCKGMVFDRLLQESTVQAAEMDRLRAENAQLRGEQES